MIAHKIECENEPHFTTNVSCTIIKLDTGGAKVNFTGTFVVDVDRIWMRHQNFIGFGKGKFKMGYIGATLDLCDLTKTIRGTFLNRFLEESLDKVKNIVHPCPYRKNEVIHMENVVFAGSIYLQFLRPATYRFDYRIYGDRNRTIAYMKYYASVGYVN
jgi:Protein of unknown function (DUF1091)